MSTPVSQMATAKQFMARPTRNEARSSNQSSDDDSSLNVERRLDFGGAVPTRIAVVETAPPEGDVSIQLIDKFA